MDLFPEILCSSLAEKPSFRSNNRNFRSRNQNFKTDNQKRVTGSTSRVGNDVSVYRNLHKYELMY